MGLSILGWVEHSTQLRNLIDMHGGEQLCLDCERGTMETNMYKLTT